MDAAPNLDEPFMPDGLDDEPDNYDDDEPTNEEAEAINQEPGEDINLGSPTVDPEEGEYVRNELNVLLLITHL